MNIAVLIAAAGQSSRMGSPKALLPISGESALIHVAKFFTGRPKLKIFATLPPSLLVHQELTTNAKLFGIQLRHNFYPKLGYWGSINTIVQEILAWADGVIINPIDAPGLSSELVSTMMCLAQKYSKPTIIVPYAYGFAGHPVYLSAHFFADIYNNIYASLAHIIRAKHEHLISLYWGNLHILVNLNKTSDHLRYTAELSGFANQA